MIVSQMHSGYFNKSDQGNLIVCYVIYDNTPALARLEVMHKMEACNEVSHVTSATNWPLIRLFFWFAIQALV